MKLRSISAATGPRPVGPYTQALEVSDVERLLFISGQVPESATGDEPQDFEAQASLVWRNVIAQLEAADMSARNLVKVTTYLASRDHKQINRDVREAMLGSHMPALTVIVAGIFEEQWLIEIEAIAAA